MHIPARNPQSVTVFPCVFAFLGARAGLPLWCFLTPCEDYAHARGCEQLLLCWLFSQVVWRLQLSLLVVFCFRLRTMLGKRTTIVQRFRTFLPGYANLSVSYSHHEGTLRRRVCCLNVRQELPVCRWDHEKRPCVRKKLLAWAFMCGCSCNSSLVWQGICAVGLTVVKTDCSGR